MIFFNKNKTIFLSLLFSSLLQSPYFLHAEVIHIAEEKHLEGIFNSEYEAIIMATSDHCHWCIQTKPHFTDLEKQYGKKIKFYSVNGNKTHLQKFLDSFTSNGNHLAKNMLTSLKKHRALGDHKTVQIPGYPTFLYVKHGKIVDIHIGGCSKETLEKIIEKNHK